MKNLFHFALIMFCSFVAHRSMADQVAVYFPVTSYCEKYTNSYFMNSNQKGYDAKYQKFLIPLMEHKSIAGFVEISSVTLNKRELLDIWLNVKKSCYANAAMTTDLDGHVIKFLQSELGVFEILGADVKGGKLTVFYRDEPVK